MIHQPERTKDVTKAVRVLRKHGVPVSFPMQTANGKMIFAVGKDFTVTAEQILELLDGGDFLTRYGSKAHDPIARTVHHVDCIAAPSH